QVLRALGESRHELARTRFNQYGPLIQLGQPDAAKRVVEDCLTVFRDVDDVLMQAMALSALATIWDAQGDTTQAIALERQSLAVYNRLLRPDDRANAHHNLSNYLVTANQPDAAARHLLASFVYDFVTSHCENLSTSLYNLGIRIHRAAQSGGQYS